MSKTVAVFGATGTSGGAAMRHLIAAGFHVRAVTRNPDSDAARHAASFGAVPVAGDLNDRASIRNAIQGADAVYYVGTSAENRWDIGQAVQGINAVDAAIEVGIQHYVFQSALVADARGVLIMGSKRAIEERLAELPLRTTILRPGFFMENLLRFFAPVEKDGKLVFAIPIPPEKENGLIAAEDIGKAAAAVISDPDRYAGAEIKLVSDVGSPSQMTRILGEEMGCEASTVYIPLDDIKRDWPQGVDDIHWLSTRTTKDNSAELTALIGKTTSFREWTREIFIPFFKRLNGETNEPA
ncbi:NmrA/HSCARG family protein [Rhizorhabdus argentea]|uniref:NmrA/HSCARG family protein n=1 Tax=Rhizorhabdus argentea TaxID=1387174 RepID=UPI0030EDBC9F